MKTFALDKMPGCDGLSWEVYDRFWNKISVYYYEAIQYGIRVGKLHDTARRGVLSLIPKKDRNPMLLKNWRPLTMLSLDYKVFSKALDNRLKVVMQEFIEDYQTGFMAGRNILTNVLKLMLIMSEADAKKTSDVIMLIDFHKCFNCIEFTAIRGSLKYFGIGDKFVEYVMLLFTDFQLCTQNNGYISNWITPQCGVHQGRPVSPHLYNCTGQVFADILQNNTQINGILAQQIQNLLAQFADDTTLFLHGSDGNVQAVTEVLMYAHQNLGLQVNFDKTTIYRIGSMKQTNAKYYVQSTYAWDDPPIYTLGVYVSENINHMARLNFLPVLEKAKETLQAWQQRNLTLTGRVLIVNTLIESKFVYRMGVTLWVAPVLR